jgi:hypothetical protein
MLGMIKLRISQDHLQVQSVLDINQFENDDVMMYS